MEDKKVKPISPDEVIGKKGDYIPDEVISAFNTLIAKNFYCGSSTFKQDEVVEEIINNLKLMTGYQDVIRDTIRGQIFKNNWLDVEGIYRETGWDVEYDKPAFNEDYPASFTFKRKAK